ncbi:hypothetical protein SAMN02910451_00703 [Butyrivibrio hungatei]|uniref:Uncharacterized protein n=1 Tax=Butyrivibrio hungatei TaxID=185008 RepID=A0A1G5BFC8_9FIRM|nr:hypothetical protein [Butyrivibrio hungatei]MBR4639602.1 hypothetical protein [Butyrivibrio sp.]SCX88848.1 hypothetical protein SAMN02910451_00703 [Butyrivibrio hungatei]
MKYQEEQALSNLSLRMLNLTEQIDEFDYGEFQACVSELRAIRDNMNPRGRGSSQAINYLDWALEAFDGVTTNKVSDLENCGGIGYISDAEYCWIDPNEDFKGM